MPRDIEEYRRKRRFDRTPEPPAGPADDSGPAEERRVFVIHRHEARRLHYDLRLEMDGVLRSWAVPKGFSYDPQEKKLAVQTEDHPIEYEDFHGVIPKGEYGAGTMTIWDRGTYTFRNRDAEQGVPKGKLELILYGRRLRGEWHMVKTKKEEHGWLLFKSRDPYARSAEESAGADLQAAVPAAMPWSDPETETSFLARTYEGEAFGTAATGPEGTGAATGPEATEGTASDREEVGKPNRAKSAARSARTLSDPKPMLPGKRLTEPFADPDWLFEMGFEGQRVWLVKQADEIEIRVGKKEIAAGFPEVVRDARKIRAERVVIDGMMVALDDGGRPSSVALEERLLGTNERQVQIYVFDMIYFEEYDVRAVPLIERKAQLASILPTLRTLQFVDHVPGNGETLARAMSQSGLTLMIGKRTTSSYESGKSKDWVEIPVLPVGDARRRSLGEALAEGIHLKPKDERIRFTNLKKVYWPDEGFTKGDLVAYYEQIAEFILPYLIDRPVHLYRFPDGIEGEAFYQHEAPGHLPQWFDTIPIPSGSKERDVPHMVVTDRSSLLYLINLGSIDLHPWLSHRPTLGSPDWAVIDLDPKEAPFTDVVKIARAVKKILDAIGLRAGLKTSGSTGLHIFIPIAPGYDYDQARGFAEALARVVAKEQKDIATVERVTRHRKSKVYVDFLQNRQGQTVVPAYVVRPKPGATVSTPLHWEELESPFTPADFHIRNVPQRLAKVGDLFRPYLGLHQDLLPALERLGEYLKK
ncbi:MAG: non-homologous end-joining DNA ligase [Candidatus Eisenbacteria bacterium]